MNTARPSLPIIEHVPVRFEQADHDRIDQLATRLLKAEPALSTTEVFGASVSTGLEDGPALLFEDHTEIALFQSRGDASLQYRALLLAGDGDIVLIGGQRSPEFEVYCRDVLALGKAKIISVAPTASARSRWLAQGFAAHPNAFCAVYEAAREHGRLNLIPYIGMGRAWVLAEHIASHTGARIKVAAPPPRLTRRVNDKLWFAGRVQELLGSAALPPSYHAFGPAALAGRVAALARRFDRVVIKVPDSAGSAGNLVLDAHSVRGVRLRSLRYRLLRLLRSLGWHATFPLMVSVWDCAVLSSPSVQLWVPSREDGLPIVEGVFDQVVEGSAGEFVGAVPCSIPAAWQQRLADEAMQLACLFQRLGYFGRCSFDAVLAGEDFACADLHWIECNGRWGGTSIPMTLANRLVGDWARRSFMIVQRTDLTGPARDLSGALNSLGSLLFGRTTTDTGVVLLTPGGLEQGTGLHFLLLGNDASEVKRQTEALETLFGSAVGGRT